MATSADVLRSVNLILQSGQERERFEVQTALTMMQLAQTKKAQDIEISSKSLELATAANTQMKYDIASSFLQSAGLGAMHAHFTTKYPTKALQKAVVELKKPAGKGDLGLGAGMTDVEANRVVSAIWSLQGEAKNADPMINLATDIKGVNDYSYDKSLPKPSGSSIRMHSALGALGFFEDELRSSKQLASVAKYISNKQNILQETFELSQGDTDIQSDIGAYDPKVETLSDVVDKAEEIDPAMIDAMEALLEGDEEWERSYGKTALIVGGLYGAQMAGEAIVSEYGKYQTGSKKYMERLAKDILSKKQGGLTPKGFAKKYDMGKKVAKTEEGIRQLSKLAKSAGYKATSTVQAAESIRNMKYIKGIADVSKKLQVGRLATFATPYVASEVGGYLGGELGTAIGQTAGTAFLVNRVVKPDKVPFIKFLAKRFPSIAAKVGVSAMADSPLLPIGDIIGGIIGIAEIYHTYKAWEAYVESD